MYSYLIIFSEHSGSVPLCPSGNRNHEAGMLVCGESMIEAPLHHFDRVWNDPDILKHTWKRFAKMAKDFLRKD